MPVWRFYRANIEQWRGQQNPAPPGLAPTPEETARLQDQARHLAAQRLIQMLNEPGLSPSYLMGLIRNETNRQRNQLARELFNDHVAFRDHIEQKPIACRPKNTLKGPTPKWPPVSPDTSP